MLGQQVYGGGLQDVDTGQEHRQETGGRGSGSYPACLPQVSTSTTPPSWTWWKLTPGILAVLDEACSTAGPITAGSSCRPWTHTTATTHTIPAARCPSALRCPLPLPSPTFPSTGECPTVHTACLGVGEGS